MGIFAKTNKLHVTFAVVIIVASVLFILREVYQPQQIMSSQTIYQEVVNNKNMSNTEKADTLKQLDESFTAQCGMINKAPEDCRPFVILAYLKSRQRLSIPQEDVYTDVSLRALDYWKQFFIQIEFNTEGNTVIGGQEKDYNFPTFSDFSNLLFALPISDKKDLLHKLEHVNPKSTYNKILMLGIFREIFNPENKAGTISRIPENYLRYAYFTDLCNYKIKIEQEKDVCEFYYYVLVNRFCEMDLPVQELEQMKSKVKVTEMVESGISRVCREEVLAIV